MDCDAVTDCLVDLLYEELVTSEAEAARAHLEGCDSCSGAFARLESGRAMSAFLALEEPPASVRATVLAAARDKAAEARPQADRAAVGERAAPARDDVAIDPEDEGLWASMLKWVGGLAMRPQLAMAMTLLLMVGIGLWYLPELRRNDPADAHAIVDPAPGDEVGPSAALAPAEPLDLRADPRTGRIRPVEGDESPTPRRPRPSEDTATQVANSQGGGVEESPLPVEVEDSDEAAGEMVLEPGQMAALAPNMQDDRGVGSVDSNTLAARPGGAASPGGVETGPLPTAPQPIPQPAPPPAVAAGDARYQRGMQRYRERDFRGAATDFDAVLRGPRPDTGTLLPSALHHLARSRRAAGQCAAAVRSYERLFSEYATYSGAPSAMIEAGDCYRRLGRLSDARRVLERARSHRSVATAAQRELAVLAAAERAHGSGSTATGAAEAATPPEREAEPAEAAED